MHIHVEKSVSSHYIFFYLLAFFVWLISFNDAFRFKRKPVSNPGEEIDISGKNRDFSIVFFGYISFKHISTTRV